MTRREYNKHYDWLCSDCGASFEVWKDFRTHQNNPKNCALYRAQHIQEAEGFAIVPKSHKRLLKQMGIAYGSGGLITTKGVGRNSVNGTITVSELIGWFLQTFKRECLKFWVKEYSMDSYLIQALKTIREVADADEAIAFCIEHYEKSLMPNDLLAGIQDLRKTKARFSSHCRMVQEQAQPSDFQRGGIFRAGSDEITLSAQELAQLMQSVTHLLLIKRWEYLRERI